MKPESGYDFDGTISAGLIPSDNSVVVTGRNVSREVKTRAELEKMGRKDIPIYFYSGPYPEDPQVRSKYIGEFKIETIKELKLKTFYDDDPIIVGMIKEAFPDMNVVLISEMKKEEPRLKYIMFSWYTEQAGSVAWQLQHEGCVVDFGEIRDIDMTRTDGEEGDPEDPKDMKRRLSAFDGLLSKHDADVILKVMPDIQNKDDYFIFCDNNNAFRYTEAALKMGFTKGTFPTQEDRLLEVNRNDAKDIVKKHYPGIKLKDYKTFKDIKEGIEFMEESEFPYVLKSLGDSGETVVPKTDNLEINRKEVVDALTNNKNDYEENGYLLEQKIIGGIEFTPAMFFWDGKPVFCDLDLETKTINSGENGSNVGCGTNLMIHTNLDDKINKLAFPPYIREKYKDTKGMRLIDCGLLLDPADDSIYFLEFCPNRVGWDAFPTELTMSDKPDLFFEKISKGQDPLMHKYGAAVRVFNDTLDKERHPSADIGMVFKKDLWDYVFPYDIKAPKPAKNKPDQEEDDDYYKFVTAGYAKDAAAITCKGDDLKEVIEMLYGYLKDFSMKDMAYRPIDDFESFSYSQSILNRLDYITNIGLLSDPKLKKDILAMKSMPRKLWKYKPIEKDDEDTDSYSRTF